jgi:hypothetical protein
MERRKEKKEEWKNKYSSLLLMQIQKKVVA